MQSFAYENSEMTFREQNVVLQTPGEKSKSCPEVAEGHTVPLHLTDKCVTRQNQVRNECAETESRVNTHVADECD